MGLFHSLIKGFHLIAYLRTPTKKRLTTERTELQYYKKIEDDIHRSIGNPLFINTRKNQGKTEWFYTSIEKLDKAFKDAHKKYGGELDEYDLEDLPLKIKNRVKFTGRINFY